MTREELLTKAKPILFNTEMVIAILEGRKTATRRVVKPQPDEKHNFPLGFVSDSTNKKDIGKFGFGIDEFGGSIQHAKPPCKKGDYLYVLETWTEEYKEFYYRADYDSDYLEPCETLSGGYPADCRYYPGCVGCTRGSQRIMWHPSIHMPKEAARIFLKVTDVRVERLQMMNGKDVLKEGVDNGSSNPTMGYRFDVMQRMAFKDLWNSTIKTADLDKYGGDANPWVWVIEFERVEV